MHGKYSDDYNTIVKWLNEAQSEGKLNWKNYSVSKHDPLIDPNTTVGKNKLKKQIRPASKVIIISGMYAAYSEWIDYEIDTSMNYGKYIIGVKPWGQERVPLKINNNAMVDWNRSSVINAILNS